jgi:hypothetical protein
MTGKRWLHAHLEQKASDSEAKFVHLRSLTPQSDERAQHANIIRGARSSTINVFRQRYRTLEDIQRT